MIMTQENRELLIKDLCARLPYGVKGKCENLNENTKYSIPKFLYHATPSCYLSSIKKNGLGGKIPRKRFWDYDNTEYANIKKIALF